MHPTGGTCVGGLVLTRLNRFEADVERDHIGAGCEDTAELQQVGDEKRGDHRDDADHQQRPGREVVERGLQGEIVVLEVDNKRKRLRLSIRRAEQVEGATNLKEFAQRQAEEKASEGVGNATMFEALKRAKLVE